MEPPMNADRINDKRLSYKEREGHSNMQVIRASCPDLSWFFLGARGGLGGESFCFAFDRRSSAFIGGCFTRR
jgi:hypothetical protein